MPRILRLAYRLLADQERLLFQPDHRSLGNPTDSDLEVERIRLPDGRGSELYGWWLAGVKGSKRVLLLPGTTGNPARELPVLSFLSSLGLTVLALEYPGCARSPGKPDVAACRRAAAAGWRFLLDRGSAPEDIILYGHSLGSAFAVELAARGGGGLVFHSGFSSVAEVATLSLPNWLVRGFCRVRLDSTLQIPRCRCPVLVLHADDDELVPSAMGRRVYHQATDPKRFLSYSGGHFSTEWRDDPRVRDSWDEMLSGAAADWAGADTSPPGHKPQLSWNQTPAT